jgi:Protein of unknown function (DUF3305)
MSIVAPLIRVPVGIVVERRRAISPWVDLVWRPVAVLPGRPEATPWSQLAQDGDTVTYYAGPGEIALYRTEADNYRRNLESGAPSVWVALEATGGEPPFEVAAVTADPAEGEALTEPGQAIVEALAMPEAVCEAIARFVAEYPAAPPFTKRKRDRADPEVLARRDPPFGKDDEGKDHERG